MVLFLLARVCHAEGEGLTFSLVSQDKGKVTISFRDQIQDHINFSEININDDSDYPDSDVYIVLGPRALQKTIREVSNKTIIAVFCSRKSFEEIREKDNNNRLTAIYADPSPRDQLELISALYPENTKVLVLASPTTVSWNSKQRQSSKKNHLDAKWHVVEDVNELNISELAKGFDVILGVSDPNIYSSQTMKNIIQYSYRNKKGFIGFSYELTRIGALASIFPTINNLIQETMMIVESYQSDRFIPIPAYPKKVNVSVNKYIARSFDIYKHNTDEIALKINALDRFSESEIHFVYDEILVDDKWI